MKKITYFVFVSLMMLVASCSDVPTEISKGTIKSAVADVLEENMLDQSYTNIRTGYYECNSLINREKLAKLAAAGIIQYKVERYAWWNKYLSAGYSWGGYYGNKEYYFEEHFMVDVQLTDEGKKIKVDSIPVPEKKVDKDMQQPEVDLTKFPEYNYEKENWPEIPNPERADVKAEDQNEEVVPDTTAVADIYSNLNDIFEDVEDNLPEITDDMRQALLPLDAETKIKYDAAKEKENHADVILKSSALKVDKARYIQTYVDQTTGLSHATAEVIVKTVDVTAPGRILDGKYEDTKLCAKVEFIYYNDKGWVLLNHAFAFAPVSDVAIEHLKQNVQAIGQDISAAAAQKAIQQVVNAASNMEDAVEEVPEYDY